MTDSCISLLSRTPKKGSVNFCAETALLLFHHAIYSNYVNDMRAQSYQSSQMTHEPWVGTLFSVRMSVSMVGGGDFWGLVSRLMVWHESFSGRCAVAVMSCVQQQHCRNPTALHLVCISAAGFAEYWLLRGENKRTIQQLCAVSI